RTPARARTRAALAQVRSRSDQPGDRPADRSQRNQRRHDPAPHDSGAARRVDRRSLAMDDRFLNELRREPRPEFAHELQRKLHAQGEARNPIAVRMVPALAVSFAAIAIVGLFAFPAVRASAQAMLDLFRVRKFSAISYDATRIEKLRALAKQTGNET